LQPDKANELAQSLLAVTLSAESSVASGDWETAGQLLRRREQILTQLERMPSLDTAREVLIEVQRAEKSLMLLMDRSTRETAAEIGKIHAFRSRQNPYARTISSAGLFEKFG
jgi:hypothetical protein